MEQSALSTYLINIMENDSVTHKFDEVTRSPRDWCTYPVAAFHAFIVSSAYKETALKERRSETISAASASVYLSMFSRFNSFLEQHNLTIFTVEADHIYRFLTQTTKITDPKTGETHEHTQLNSAIQSRYIRLLERTFTFLGRNPRPTDYLFFGPMREHYKLAGKDKKTITLSDEQIQAFMDSLPRHSSTDTRVRKYRISGQWKKNRDRAIQCLMLGAGLKVAEVIALHMDEIDSTVQLDGTLKVELKLTEEESSKKHDTFYEHTTFVRAEFVQEILAWKREREELHLQGTLLFPNHDGLPLNKATVYRQVKKSFERAGIDIDRMGGRTLRNTFAVQELVSGTTEEELIGKLGLFEDRSVSIYVAAAED